MANLNSHPLVMAAYEACLLIEKLPASPEETAAVSAVSAMLEPIEALAKERDALAAECRRLRERVERQTALAAAETSRAGILCQQRNEAWLRVTALEQRWDDLKRWLYQQKRGDYIPRWWRMEDEMRDLEAK